MISRNTKVKSHSKMASSFASSTKPMFPSTEDTDVVLKVENEVLHLHNGILSMYSPVFKIMLNGAFKEGLNKEVVLKQKKAQDVLEFFKFFYPDQRPELTGKSISIFCGSAP